MPILSELQTLDKTSSNANMLEELRGIDNPAYQTPIVAERSLVDDLSYDLAGRVENVASKFGKLRKQAEAEQATSVPSIEPWNFLKEEKQALWNIAKPVPALSAGQVATAVAGGARLAGYEKFADDLSYSAKEVQRQIQLESPVEQGSLDEATRGALTSIYTILPGILTGTGAALLGRQAAMPIIKSATLAGMGGLSAGQTLESQLTDPDNPSGKETAVGAAVVNAAAEVIPEMISWNILFGKGTKLGVKAAKLYLSEILGENSTTAVNLGVNKLTISPDMTSEDAIKAFKDTTKQTIIMTSILQGPSAGLALHNQTMIEDNAKLKEVVDQQQTPQVVEQELSPEEDAEAARLAKLALRDTAIVLPKPEDLIGDFETLKVAGEQPVKEESTLDTPLPETKVENAALEMLDNDVQNMSPDAQISILAGQNMEGVGEPIPENQLPAEMKFESEAPTTSIIPLDDMQNPHINSAGATDRGAFRLVLEAPPGSEATPENVKQIIVDPDGYTPNEMISKIRELSNDLKTKYPNATFSVVDSRGDGEPTEIFKAKQLGNQNLSKIKKIFGATEDINPRVARKSISKEEKVARLILKDKKTVKELGKTNPEMVNRLLKYAGRKGELESTVKVLSSEPAKPAIQSNVWYQGFKDGAAITSRDRAKIEAELGAGVEIIQGKVDGVNFVPDGPVKVESNSVLSDMVKSLPSLGLSTMSTENLLAQQEARARLAEAAFALVRKAGGKPFDEFAKSVGFTPEQTVQMKDALRAALAEVDEEKIEKQNKEKKVKQLSTVQKAHELQKALGMSDSEFEAFKLLSVGKPSMGKKAANPMTTAEKKKVLNDLMALYEEKQGEKYDFKVKSAEQEETQMAIKAVVGIEDREYSRKELAERAWRYAIAHGKSWLEQTPSGKVLAKLLNRIVTESTIETGGLLELLRPHSAYIKDHNDRLMTKLLAAEKAETGWEKFLGEQSGKDLEVFTAYKELMNTIQQMAINRDLKVTEVKLEGKKVKLVEHAFPNEMDKIYFPHMLIDQSKELSVRNKMIAVESLMKPTKSNPNGRTAEEAARLFKVILESKRGMVRDPYLEYTRQYDVEGFNQNLLEVASIYTARAVKRLYTIDYFGADQKKVNNLINRHAQEGGDKSIAEYVTTQVLGTNVSDAQPWMRQLANAAIGFEVITKMGPFSALAQLGQFGFTYEETNLKTMARTLARVLKGSTQEEAISFGYRSGAALGSIIKEFQDYIKNDTLTDKYLVAAGFTPLDRFARILSSVAGREYVTDLFEKVRRNPTKAGSAKIRLKQFGIDAEKVLSENRELSDDELRFAGLHMSEITQYRGGALNLPAWVAPTPVIRMITLFHQFSYHRVRTLVDRFNENPTFFAKRLIPSLLSATAFGALGSEVRRLFTDKERPDSFWKLWFEYLVMGGWFGMANDALQAVFRSPTGLAAYITGPVVGDIGKVFYDGMKAIGGSVDGLLKDFSNIATYPATKLHPAAGVAAGLASRTINGRLLTKEEH